MSIKQSIMRMLRERRTIRKILSSIKTYGLPKLESGKTYVVYLDCSLGQREAETIREQLHAIAEKTGAKFVLAEKTRITPCE